jgi:hypothetical protein
MAQCSLSDQRCHVVMEEGEDFSRFALLSIVNRVVTKAHLRKNCDDGNVAEAE